MDLLEKYWRISLRSGVLVDLLSAYPLHPEWMEDEFRGRIYYLLCDLLEEQSPDTDPKAFKAREFDPSKITREQDIESFFELMALWERLDPEKELLPKKKNKIRPFRGRF